AGVWTGVVAVAELRVRVVAPRARRIPGGTCNRAESEARRCDHGKGKRAGDAPAAPRELVRDGRQERRERVPAGQLRRVSLLADLHVKRFSSLPRGERPPCDSYLLPGSG